ncbi:MAG TPA: nucleotide disphospho-sugar-binding domain-containing protein, partial [Microlunatus sp.]|nr:nucleotide disphospho-sugar-binding domain-containing protein [Microlunatus sp.]
AYGLMLPVVPLVWAARAAGHEVLLATTSEMTDVAARAGLPVIDVYPDRTSWAAYTALIGHPGDLSTAVPPEIVAAAHVPAPFAMFTALMTDGTAAAAHSFVPDVVATTGDHPAGSLAARAAGVPVLEVGNRISWSHRDADWRSPIDAFAGPGVLDPLRARLGIPADTPTIIARIDPRAPSMGGLDADQPDPRDGRPWWPMQYVPYNGGAVLPDWLAARRQRPRIGVTLGTVVPMMSGTTSLSVVLEALADVDADVVLAAGAADLGALGTLPDNVRSVGYLPLSVFLPTCDLLVHHGGSGTTAAPLFYGVPQLVLPSFADNPLSGQRVADRGVGLSQDPSTLTGELVRDLVLRLLTDPSFGAAALEVQAEIAAQPSPATIIDRLDRELASRLPRAPGRGAGAADERL